MKGKIGRRKDYNEGVPGAIYTHNFQIDECNWAVTPWGFQMGVLNVNNAKWLSLVGKESPFRNFILV